MTLASWEGVASAARVWATARAPRAGDVPLVLYRDANAWCPFCHRVWFWMEQKGLRYETQRIHLGGDPREPPKQPWYLREVAPRGNVPALRIGGDEIVLESLDILERLDAEFPGHEPAADDSFKQKMLQTSGAFDTDCDRWLHNTHAPDEAALRGEALQKLTWLEEALRQHGGPFFLGAEPSIVDAAFVGFLTRLAVNYKFFKGLDVHEVGSAWPRLSAWLRAVERTPGGRATKQDVAFEQRIYQAHPLRRAAAEPCMQLHPTRLGVGEPSDWRAALPSPPVAALQPGGEPALEAAWRLCERRTAVAGFLQRTRQEAALVAAGAPRAQPDHHWKARRGSGPWKGPAPSSTAGAEVAEAAEERAATERHLCAVAAVLTGLQPAAEAARHAGGPAAIRSGPVAALGSLVGTPRDMSVAAAAQLRAALASLTGEEAG